MNSFEATREAALEQVYKTACLALDEIIANKNLDEPLEEALEIWPVDKFKKVLKRYLRGEMKEYEMDPMQQMTTFISATLGVSPNKIAQNTFRRLIIGAIDKTCMAAIKKGAESSGEET